MANCKNKNCGCQDTGLTTPPPCNPIGCPDPEPCSETFNAECIIYLGATLPDYNINNGDTVADVLQKILFATSNPDCYRYIQLFKAASINSTAISFEWEGTNTLGYRIDYSLDNDAWVIGTTISGNIGIVSGLTSNTNYYFRLAALQMEASPCFSLTLKLKTL